MAKPHPNTVLPPLFLFTLLLLLVSSSSAARLLITEPVALNLALPGLDDVVLTDFPAVGASGGRRVLPCKTEINANRKARGVGFRALRLCGGQGKLLLSKLPKGGVPPSGPSGRTNDINN